MTTPIRILIVSLVAASLATALTSAAAAQDRKEVVPSMKVLFENDRVRVQEHDVKVGEKVPMHSHPPHVVIAFNDAKVRFTFPDGTTRVAELKAGQVGFNEGGSHAVENIGSTDIRNLVVELKELPAKAKASTEQADEAAIKKLQDDIEAAYNAADLDRLMSFHTDDVIYLAPGKPAIEGWKAVRDDFQAIFEGWTRRRVIAKLDAQSPHEVVVCGDWAFARGQSTLTFTPKDGGTPTQVFAKFISIYRRQPDGSWKRCRQMRNGDRPQDNI